MLPQKQRRRFFISLFCALSPRPSPAPTAKEPVIVGGVLVSATGLGESARMNVEGLRQAGIPYGTIDLSGTFLGSRDLSLPPDGGGATVSGPGSLILHVSSPFVPYALRQCGRAIVRNKHVIGFWHWELPRLPGEWRAGMPFVHEVWVPSRFCAEAVAQDYRGPVAVIPHPVDVGSWRKAERGDGRFTALSMFNMASGFERKNPLGAVCAFQRAFGRDEDARLVLKVLNPDAYPAGMAALMRQIDGYPNIEVVTRSMARHDVLALIAQADAVLSLHRSEGFGLLAAEAMLIGVPVIATDWSATTDFVTPETGLPIPYRLVPAVDPQGSYHCPDQSWADPDVDSAAAALASLRNDPAFAQALAARARRAAEEMFSMARYAERIRTALGDSPPPCPSSPRKRGSITPGGSPLPRG